MWIVFNWYQPLTSITVYYFLIICKYPTVSYMIKLKKVSSRSECGPMLDMDNSCILFTVRYEWESLHQVIYRALPTLGVLNVYRYRQLFLRISLLMRKEQRTTARRTDDAKSDWGAAVFYVRGNPTRRVNKCWKQLTKTELEKKGCKVYILHSVKTILHALGLPFLCKLNTCQSVSSTSTWM